MCSFPFSLFCDALALADEFARQRRYLCHLRSVRPVTQRDKYQISRRARMNTPPVIRADRLRGIDRRHFQRFDQGQANSIYGVFDTIRQRRMAAGQRAIRAAADRDAAGDTG